MVVNSAQNEKKQNIPFNPFSPKLIFVEKKKKKVVLRNFIATLVFMLERKILSNFFFSQLIEIFFIEP